MVTFFIISGGVLILGLSIGFILSFRNQEYVNDYNDFKYTNEQLKFFNQSDKTYNYRGKEKLSDWVNMFDIEDRKN